MISFICVLLIVKLVLSCWLFRGTFYYSGGYLFLHLILDIICLIHKSYWLGTLSFILKPYILAACIAEIYNFQLLRKINIIGCIGTVLLFITLPFFFNLYVNLPILTAFFGAYSLLIFVLLNERVLEFKKETYPLMSALTLMIPETIIFFQFKYVYLLINIINLVYYLGLLLFLLFFSRYIVIVTSRNNQLSDRST
jgi:hypothetical protein